MAVAKVASTQFTVQSDGTATLALPAGTAAGHGLVAWCEDGRSTRPADVAGWTSSSFAFGATWFRAVTAADVTAGSVSLLGEVTGLVTVSGCRGWGARRSGAGLTVSESGAAVLVTAFRPPPASTVDPSGSRLDSVVEHEDWPHSWWLLTGGTAGSWLGLSGTNSGATYYAVELLPLVGPAAPVLVSPLAGAQVDAAAVTSLIASHQSTSGSTQTAIKSRVRGVGGGTWYYVDAGGNLQVAEQILTQSSGTVPVDAGTFAAGTEYEWGASTQDEGVWSPWSPSQTFRAVAVPTVTSVTVTSAAEDLSPLVEAVLTAGYGAISAWRVWITPAGAADHLTGTLWDSGILAYTGSASTVVPSSTAWTNGADHEAWVQCWQSGGLGSVVTVDDVDFTVSWTAPAAPSLVSASTLYTPPRATIGWSGVREGWALEWSRDSGGTWEPYTDSDLAGVSLTGIAYVRVPLAPYEGVVYFRARVWDLVDGVRIYSDWKYTATALTSTDAGAYLVDATDPSAYLAVTVGSDEPPTPVQGVTVSYGHGATSARVDRTEVQGWEGETTLTVLTSADRDAILTWLTERTSWYLRRPAERDGSTLEDGGSTLMTLAARPGVGRLAQVAVTARAVTFPWVSQ